MKGTNPKRAPLAGDGSVLEVKNIFKTIQGEGPFVGTASIFIRLGGCNLACSFCDTQFEDFSKMPLIDIIRVVNNLSYNEDKKKVIKLVVITGGEPFRQPIELLCEELIKRFYHVQIETNGTLYRNLHEKVDIICSPKFSGGNYVAIHPLLLERLSAIKFLISKNIKGYNEVHELGQTLYNIPVFVQPIDEEDSAINEENMKFATAVAIKYGYRLSLQIHKILQIE